MDLSSIGDDHAEGMVVSPSLDDADRQTRFGELSAPCCLCSSSAFASSRVDDEKVPTRKSPYLARRLKPEVPPRNMAPAMRGNCIIFVALTTGTGVVWAWSFFFLIKNDLAVVLLSSRVLAVLAIAS